MKIRRIDSDELKKHFADFVLLFAENTRGHVIDHKIEDVYILHKVKELIEYLAQEKAVLFGMFSHKKLVGFLWSYPRVFLEEKRMYINSLIISSKYRGKSYGQMLIKELEKYTVENNLFAIDVTTASFKTDAIEFYKKIGFKPERVQMRKALNKL